MLILSRKQGEELLIGDDVRVKVNWIRGHSVSLAVEAPRQTRILRGELKENESGRENRTDERGTD